MFHLHGQKSVNIQTQRIINLLSRINHVVSNTIMMGAVFSAFLWSKENTPKFHNYLLDIKFTNLSISVPSHLAKSKLTTVLEKNIYCNK